MHKLLQCEFSVLVGVTVVEEVPDFLLVAGIAEYPPQVIDVHMAFVVLVEKPEQLLQSDDAGLRQNSFLVLLIVMVGLHLFVDVKVAVVLLTPRTNSIQVLC